MELDTDVGDTGLSDLCGDELIELEWERECEFVDDDEDVVVVIVAAVVVPVVIIGALYVQTIRSLSHELYNIQKILYLIIFIVM